MPHERQIPPLSHDSGSIRPWDRFEATFQPRRTDDLKPGARDWIGRRAVWDYAWIIDEEDGGPYVGEAACTLADPPDDHPGFVWVPSGDLVDVAIRRRIGGDSAS